MVDTVGQDADILLYHEDVNGGVRFGLQLYSAQAVKNKRMGKTFAEHVTTQYLIDGETMTKYFFFTVLACHIPLFFAGIRRRFISFAQARKENPPARI